MQTLTTAASTSAGERWEGGKGQAPFTGTWGGGTAKLQATYDGTNWIDLVDDKGEVVTLTANGVISYELGECNVRGNLAGSTGATVNFSLRPVR